MLTALFASVALAGGLPSIEVTWKGSSSTLRVVAPAGEHLAEDAPQSLALNYGEAAFEIDAPGPVLAKGLTGLDLRGKHVTGEADLSVCLDGGTSCRFLAITFEGDVPEAKKGKVLLLVDAQDVATGPGGPFKLDAAAAAEKAFAEAASRGVPVLIDFTAVWCPPCDLFEAEVLHDPDYADLIDDFVVLAIDVDDQSSWALKDRYAVSSYPTVVVARADGTEIDHMIGYDGADTTATWLAAARDGEFAAAATPEARARRAWNLFELGREEDAAKALAEAAGAEDTVPYRLTRMVLTPTVDDARWLSDHVPEMGHDWLGYAKSLLSSDEGKVALAVGIQRALPLTDPAGAADLLSLMAEVEGEPLGRTWSAAAATMLKASFTGDDERDRGHWTDYAQLLSDAGALDEGLAFLDDARARYPGEPTWALTGARLLLEAGRPAEALTWVDRDLPDAWGDNLLRLAARRVEALQALDRAAEAKAYGAEVLAAWPPPPEGTEVRTSRYRARLEELIGDETAEAP